MKKNLINILISAVLTVSGLVYVVNQDGFVTPMKYQENNLKGLVWSMSEDRDEKITSHDLIGFGNSTIYIWDPVCAGDAMEMSFQQGFDSEALISSLDVSNMSLPSRFFVFTFTVKHVKGFTPTRCSL